MDLKNIQKVIKEAELNGGRIKKPKQRHPSTCTHLKYMYARTTWKLVTRANDGTREERRHDNHLRFGFYAGDQYEEIYKKVERIPVDVGRSPPFCLLTSTTCI